MLRCITSIFFCFLLNLACAQEPWDLKRNQDGIEVYTRRLGNEKYKEIKVITTFNATTGQLIKILKDVDHHKDWVYNAKRAYLISIKGPDTLYYYMEASLPWPAFNRDMVTQLTFKKDSGNILKINARVVPDIIPVSKNLIRIPFSVSDWTVTPLGQRQIKIEYIIRINPGGSIPAWMVNYTAAIAPFNSFKKLKHLVETSAK